MQINKKLFVYAGLPLATLGLIAAGSVSAHGMWGFGQNATPQERAQGQTQMFQNEADILGVSMDEVKAAWAQGKTLQQLATEKGISDEQLKQKMQEKRQAQMKQHLQDLVSQGVITQAQADQRLKFMQDNPGKQGGRGRGMMHGFGM